MGALRSLVRDGRFVGIGLALSLSSSCALWVEFEPRPDAGGSGGVGGVAGASTGASGGEGGVGNVGGQGGSAGGAGGASCEPTTPVGIVFEDADVAIEGMAVDGNVAWLAIIYDSATGLSARTVPSGDCSEPIIAGANAGRSSALVRVDLTSYKVTGWLPAAAVAPVDPTLADIDVDVKGGRLAVAATYEQGEVFGQAATGNGLAFSSFDLTDLASPAADGSLELPKPAVTCDGATTPIAVGVHGQNFALAAVWDDTMGALSCAACLPIDTDGADLVLFQIGPSGLCLGLPGDLRHDPRVATRPKISMPSDAEAIVGFVSSNTRIGEIVHATYVTPNSPVTIAHDTDYVLYETGQQPTDVAVAATETHAISFGSYVSSSGARHLNTRDTAGGNFTTDDLDTTGDVIVYGAAPAGATGARFFAAGAIDEADSVSTALALTTPIPAEPTGDDCATEDPAIACPDAFWVEFDADANSGVSGERWTHAGAQRILEVERASGGVVVAGDFVGGLSIGDEEVATSSSGAFIALRPH
ncbi:MAG: hypothetical protein U0271_31175 [Polyangiaceae bacterium]